MTVSTTLTQADFLNNVNAIDYTITQKLLQLNTVSLCIVQSYDAIKRTCVVNNLLTTLNVNSAPSQPVIQYNLPIMDVVGNGAGIEIEYAQGDIVLVGYCNRDISTVINYLQQGNDILPSQTFNPNSYRFCNLNDGIILGRLNTSIPAVKIKITSAGIDIIAGNNPVNINASSINITGELVINGKKYVEHKHEAGTYNANSQPVNGQSGAVV